MKLNVDLTELNQAAAQMTVEHVTNKPVVETCFLNGGCCDYEGDCSICPATVLPPQVVRRLCGDKPVEQEQLYMNKDTGSVGRYDDWWYSDIRTGEDLNAVDRNEVAPVVNTGSENISWYEEV